MRADSCSGPTTDSICGHGLGRMGHSSNFARWPHLGPIPPMDGGGHLVPLSYVYGYRGGVGRRGVAQDTIGDNGLDIRARVRRYQLILSRCAAGFVPKSAISEISRSGQRKNGRSGGNFLSDIGCAWAVLGGIPSGWGQFGAVKKWAVVIGGLRRQLNALYLTKMAWQPHLRSAFPHAYQGYACVSCVPGSPRYPHPLTRLCVWRLPPARLLVDPGVPGSTPMPRGSGRCTCCLPLPRQMSCNSSLWNCPAISWWL